jgi:hypothetical protein
MSVIGSSIYTDFNKIIKLLTNYIKTIHTPVKKNIHMHRPIKDKLGLKVTGTYCVPCKRSRVYAGKMGRTINTRFKESKGYIHLGQPEESTLAQHRFETQNSIRFNGTSILGQQDT